MIKGSIVDLITPLLADGAPDFAAVEALVDWHVSEGSNALIVGSPTGRSSSPSDSEDHGELLRRAIWQAEGRIPVIAGIAAVSTQDAIEMARAAEEFGAHAILVDTPPEGGLSQEAVLGHFRSITTATRLPLLARNLPGRGTSLELASLVALSQIKAVIGLVENSADWNRVREVLALALPRTFALYAGHDASAHRSIFQGFSGGVSVTANVAPALVRELYAAALANDRAASEALDARLKPLHEALMADAHSVPVTWALVEMGRINEGQRPPVLPQSSDYSHLRRALRAANVLG